MKWPDNLVNKILCVDCRAGMEPMPNDSVDLMVTDPPYGYSFMGKDWDRAVPKVEVWKECLRVLKPGAFAFVMCAPRQDCLARMIVNLQDAGFVTGFSSIYWTYGQGFPKAENISKAIDKKECRKQLEKKLGRKPTKKEFEKAWEGFRKVTGESPNDRPKSQVASGMGFDRALNRGQKHKTINITAPTIPQAQALDGSYGGFQPKPAVEIVLVAMKPLSEKTYVDQALKNRKGVTWLDDCRIPYESEGEQKESYRRPLDKSREGFNTSSKPEYIPSHGRFPANLLVQDDVLNDGRVRISGDIKPYIRAFDYMGQAGEANPYKGDSGSFSRYFDLDRWFAEKIKQLPASVQKTFPFLIVAKASKGEKNRGCENLIAKFSPTMNDGIGEKEHNPETATKKQNHHPTCKPLKLMCYLITLGSREGDVVLDPFVGSGTTALGCQLLQRRFVGFDNDPESVDIANHRLAREQLDFATPPNKPGVQLK